ncbi:MAG: CDF family Co(II)/Ni(II) efflux transporter DmeF [Planctomycetaceae bacterium]|nr:CDF family Co(II)/Ni(II) efflux transporter DmeF [Planctomycetaceae bacterium]
MRPRVLPIDDITPYQIAHPTHTVDRRAERNTWSVVALSSVMMVVEITAGRMFDSMALLADGWHMGTDVAALVIAASAYWLARRYADDERFAFGTFKIEVLGGFSSALLLGIVALEMVVESGERLLHPAAVRYDEALVVTCIGLVVNLTSAYLLTRSGVPHAHSHGRGHDHGTCAHSRDDDPAHKHDMNLRAAYLHVVADALTSVTAIGALVGGKYLGWIRLDPLMGILGGVVIGLWSVRLIREAGRALLDREMDHPLVDDIRRTLEADGETRVTDLHVWRVGKNQFYGALAVVSRVPRTAADYRTMLAPLKPLVHVTIEVIEP